MFVFGQRLNFSKSQVDGEGYQAGLRTRQLISRGLNYAQGANDIRLE